MNKPATTRQTYALKLATGIDYRGKNLSFDEASKLLQEANEKSGYSKKTENIKKLDIVTILEFLSSNESINKLKKTICDEVEIKSILHSESYSNTEGKKYVFFGAGCGFSFLKWDKRNTKVSKIIQKASESREDIDKLVRNSFDKEVIDYLKFLGNPIEALQAQNMVYKDTYNALIIEYINKYLSIDTVYTETRLD